MWKYLNSRKLRIFGKFASMARRYKLLKFNQKRLQTLGKWNQFARRLLALRSLQVCSKWFKLADRLLCKNDPEHRKMRVEKRWLRLFIKYQQRYPSGWKMVIREAIRQ
jgi:hypothetical protein